MYGATPLHSSMHTAHPCAPWSILFGPNDVIKQLLFTHRDLLLQNASSAGRWSEPLARTFSANGSADPFRDTATFSGVRRSHIPAMGSTPRTTARPAHARGGGGGKRNTSAKGRTGARAKTRIPLHTRAWKPTQPTCGSEHKPTIAPLSAQHDCAGCAMRVPPL